MELFRLLGTIAIDISQARNAIDVLQDYVRAAVKAENVSVVRTIIEQNRILIDFLKRFMPRGVVLDSGTLVGELTPAIDMQLSDRLRNAQRGNTR